MDFNDALGNTGRASTCKVARWLETLDKKNRDQVLTALDTMPKNRVWRGAVAFGFDGGHSTWARHFDGLCRCGK